VGSEMGVMFIFILAGLGALRNLRIDYEDTMAEAPYHAKLIIASSSVAIGPLLSEYIITSCTKALASSHDVFTIALSGGSVPTFVSELPKYCTERDINPQWSKWHVLLADERCVVETHDDSNLGLIRSKFTNHVSSIHLYTIEI
jgi:6-phosphogluconolactonase/glucosamine-6-phosphate isomerase/deaminase